MKIRSEDKRRVGSIQEYPGTYAWGIYEYRCGDCGKWFHESKIHGNITLTNDDGTDSNLCEKCGNEANAELFS